MTDIEVPVLIVGGGGAGLTASLLLSDLGISSYLVNEREGTSKLPKAHILQQRAMEIMRGAGLADEIYELGTPPEHMSATAWYAGLAGDHPNAGREIVKLEAWGAGGKDPDWAQASPCLQANFPQLRLEPLLKKHAESKAPGSIHFGHEVTELTQDSSGVTATVLNKTNNETYRVRAQYVLAADGGRSIGEKVGINLQGPRDLLWTYTVHMSADLSSFVKDDDVLLKWFWPPSFPGAHIILAAMGPEKWGRESEEWVVHMSFPEEQPQFADDEIYMGALRQFMGIGDIPVEVHRIIRWTFNALVADSFRSDRVFVLGDSAHQHGPTGGLGLTTAMQDAQNLCWKIASVLRGVGSDELLDTYQEERQPVAARNVQRSTENGMHHLEIAGAMGIFPGQNPEDAWRSMDRFWGNLPEDLEYQAAVRAQINLHSMEFNEHGVEFGYVYQSGAFVSDDHPVPQTADPVRISPVTTAPGAHIPHAELTSADGTKLALIDIAQPGEFLLILGSEGTDWTAAAADVAASTGVPIRAITIGHGSGEFHDERLAWIRRREVGETGAVLVRPDHVVAWRAFDKPENLTETLLGAVEQTLGLVKAGAAGADMGRFQRWVT